MSRVAQCYAAEQSSVEQITQRLRRLLNGRTPVVLCIGTELVVGDRLGPQTGSLIMKNMSMPLYVYGLDGSNVNALNLQLAANFIGVMHAGQPLLVVDAAVGCSHEVGNIYLYEGGIMPGAATNKNLPRVGDISLLGVVSQRGFNDFYTLKKTKQDIVDKLSDIIAHAIVKVG